MSPDYLTKKLLGENVKATLPANKAIPIFKEQISKIDSLMKLRHNDPNYDRWNNVTEQLIIRTFGDPHDNILRFRMVVGGPRFVGMPDEEWQSNYINVLKEKNALLEGYVEQLEKFGNDIVDTAIVTGEKIKTANSRKVFIVHGHDDKVRVELSSLLIDLKFEPVILHEQANEGLTLIEKFEKHSDVEYAFILLTPDDVGCQKGNETRLKPRARQNVFFEFGFFAGKIGRERVCCLYTGDVEWPSDLNGFAHIPFKVSVNEVLLDILRELKAAGY